MLMKSLTQRALYATFIAIVALIFSFNGGFQAPSKENPIDVSDDSAKAVFAVIA